MCLKIDQLACGHVSLFSYLCFQNKKFIGLISIIKISTIKMMTHGTPWNIH